MTLDEFLDDYVPRVLRPMGGWERDASGKVRRDSSENGPYCCPITAESGRWGSEYRQAAEQMGIASGDADRIAMAADHADTHNYGYDDVQPECGADCGAIRARLLAGLGLAEAA